MEVDDSTGTKTKEHGKGEPDFVTTCDVHLPCLVIRCSRNKEKEGYGLYNKLKKPGAMVALLKTTEIPCLTLCVIRQA